MVATLSSCGSAECEQSLFNFPNIHNSVTESIDEANEFIDSSSTTSQVASELALSTCDRGQDDGERRDILGDTGSLESTASSVMDMGTASDTSPAAGSVLQ